MTPGAVAARAACWAVPAVWFAAFWAFGLEGGARTSGEFRAARRPAPESFGDASDLWNDPPPARPVGRGEAGRLAETARALGPGVLVVGHPRGDGDSGTAFVVSRRLRLLATNAHVASIFNESGGMVAAGNASEATYKVGRVWFHPDYTLARSNGSLLGTLPGGRGVTVVSKDVVPDVALLQLEPGGPDLPSEWTLATPGELRELTSRAVGKLGFSGRRPARGRPLSAVFACGTVSRVGPFAPSWDVSRRWHLIDASAPMRRGDSGGPVFLENGHVVAVGTWERSSRSTPPAGSRRPIGTAAVRVDALRELLSAVGHELSR